MNSSKDNAIPYKISKDLPKIKSSNLKRYYKTSAHCSIKRTPNKEKNEAKWKHRKSRLRTRLNSSPQSYKNQSFTSTKLNMTRKFSFNLGTLWNRNWMSLKLSKTNTQNSQENLSSFPMIKHILKNNFKKLFNRRMSIWLKLTNSTILSWNTTKSSIENLKKKINSLTLKS